MTGDEIQELVRLLTVAAEHAKVSGLPRSIQDRFRVAARAAGLLGGGGKEGGK